MNYKSACDRRSFLPGSFLCFTVRTYGSTKQQQQQRKPRHGLSRGHASEGTSLMIDTQIQAVHFANSNRTLEWVEISYKAPNCFTNIQEKQKRALESCT